MKKYYIDTSIWRDYYENRKDKFRPLGEWALRLFQFIIENKYDILYSELIIEELSNEYSVEKINKIFEIVRDLLLKIKISDFQAKEAGKLCKEYKIPFGDALHAVLARDNNAILVTRDKHFLELLDIVDVRKPEELI